ncbi:M13-type metalloendopeptidase [Aliiglaciecola sp. SL4]|uniref:M13 family metallopeptidase n=1 Tax=Aliiglaciecola sp. SL4 TaxID=3239806 RepID=UPI00355C1AC6
MKVYSLMLAVIVFLWGCSDPAPTDVVEEDKTQQEAPLIENPPVELPKTEPPVEVAPETPTVETPPVVVQPKVEQPVTDTPPPKEPETASILPNSGIKLDSIDKTVKPGDNFYRFANGKWLDKAKIPADKTGLDSFQLLADKAQENVMKIIQNASQGDFKEGSNEQKVGDLYSSYTNMEARDKIGLAPLSPEFSKIDAIENQQQLAAYFAYANIHSFGTPFAIDQYIDLKKPNVYMIYSWQAGLGLPDQEYYTSSKGSYQEIKSKYRRHIIKMFELVGIEDAKKSAKMILDLETKLASKHMEKEKTRDMVALYTKIPVTKLSELMPNFDWPTMLEELGLSDLDGLVVTQTDYMRAVDSIIAKTPLSTWKIYLKWMVINQTASNLTTELDQANFEFFSKVLYGVEEQQPRWRRGVNLVNKHLGEVVGEVYVKQHFSPAAKTRMLDMVNNLLAAYEVSIKELDWMSDATKTEALDKLSKFTVKIGYPDKWKDYSQLQISKSDLIGNIKHSEELQWQQLLEKQTSPVQKHEWNLTPQTVNAYYNPPANEIVFPAGILQPPFFNMDADDAVNYGGIGAVIGHEIGHGFDDAGSTFDGDGALRNWWTETDKQEFKKRTKQLIKQYSKFKPFKDLNVNGEFTLGENIGDLGGLSIALKAYESTLSNNEAPILDGYTGQQRVLLGYAQIWAAVLRDETLRNLINTDPHSPPEYRVNGVMPNIPEFYSAFDVKKGDALYLAPKERVKIW